MGGVDGDLWENILKHLQHIATFWPLLQLQVTIKEEPHTYEEEEFILQEGETQSSNLIAGAASSTNDISSMETDV